MHTWKLVISVAIPTGIFLLVVFYLTRRFCKKNLPHIERASSIQHGIAKLQNRSINQEHGFNNKRRTNYYVLRRGMSSNNPLFSWTDNPSLITDAVENGWSRFAFTNFLSSPSVPSSKTFMGYCGTDGDRKGDQMVEITWDVFQGSADFMQKIRFNTGLKKIVDKAGSIAAGSVIKSALPLPGPALNLSPFPQEAYFEITILAMENDLSKGESTCIQMDPPLPMTEKTKSKKRDGDKIKLIQESPNGEKASSDSLVHVTSNGINTRGVFGKVEELKGRNGGKDKVEGSEMGILFSVGLAGGGSLPLKVPGSYPGSVGFNSDGSIYLEGTKLVTELEYEEWGSAEKVIGCGYNPSQKRVFFTIDSKLVREVYCTTEEFGTPLYPTLAANTDVTVLVNFGQSAFKYTQANLHRTPNPCFLGPLSSNSPVLGYDDSKELFSMGRIDAHWLDRSTKRNSAQYFGSVNRGVSDYDEYSEGDLFEIVLDNNSRGRSPSTHY
ncbi:Concanavalin A-like lectin/glucanase superfamily [Artemisia annua]|uniref:Concanavalin A-like lectin/glucanase superfamily n=1 Tax=Artemisia annua TaxID=35608 RepID=A0A2U1Q2N7_ARTAN|nr:Concanavalin A-like lectin/glucanase superfamily [Artemisia annua]